VSPRRGRSGGFALLVVVVFLAVGIGAVILLTRSGRAYFAADGCTAVVNGSSAQLSPDQARYASIIVAGSIKQDLPPRAATIALATAFQESGIANVSSGHADSVGLFQQRPSQGWGTVKQIMNPYYSTARFYTALAKVPNYRTLSITVAAQRVQRSAYGEAYAQHESRSRILASAMTGQTPAAFTCTAAHAKPTWTPGQVMTNVASAFGDRVKVAAAPAGVVVTVPASQGTPAGRQRIRWAVAQWAVANAAQAPIATVRTNGQVWLRAKGSDGWQAEKSQPAADAVTIELTVA
jgi:hypothetical protein